MMARMPPRQILELTMNILQDDQSVQRKRDLVAIGLWAMLTGRSWLVHGVRQALLREGLRYA
jgi:hypothetical protein